VCDWALTWRNVENGAPSPSFAMKAGAYLSIMLSWPGKLPVSMLAQGVFVARTVTLTRPPARALMVYLFTGSVSDKYFSKSKLTIFEDRDAVAPIRIPKFA